LSLPFGESTPIGRLPTTATPSTLPVAASNAASVFVELSSRSTA
jgi:hypothetical protein